MKTTPNEPVSLILPWSTIFRVLFVLLAVKLLAIMLPLAMPLLIAAMLAVALTPWAERLVAKGLNRTVAIFLITILFCVVTAGFLAFVLPKVYAQATEFFQSLPKLRTDILNRFGHESAFYPMLEKGLHRENFIPKSGDLHQILGAGNYVLGGFSELLLVFVLTVYLLFDGPRLIEWMKAFFAPVTQKHIDESGSEISKIISAYVFGQVVTSIFAFIFVFAGLSIVGVPNVLLLATLAGVLDVLPVLGFALAVVPAMFFALQVSGATSLIVLAVYLVYHGIENYLLVPYVYGKSLRIASFVVFFSLLVAGLVAGIEGAIAVLPLIASYPVLERIWLKKYLRPQTVAAHEAEA